MAAAAALIAAAVAIPTTSSGAQATCFGELITIVAQPGDPTVGTSGPDVILGTNGPDVINGRGGRDRICSLGSADNIAGGAGGDWINLGRGDDTARGGKGDDFIRGKRGRDDINGNRGNDEIHGGRGHDEITGGRNRDRLLGNSGNDTIAGGRGPDVINGGTGNDTCSGGPNADSVRNCEPAPTPVGGINDTFSGSGALQGYSTNNTSALPDVTRSNGRYRANLTNNSGNVTLHFNGSQGRLDAKIVAFPFDVAVRNIGIGTQANSQTAPSSSGNPYIFAGVQVHVPDFDDRTSSHVVVGHRGGTGFTVEGKNTNSGSSSVNDVGSNTAPDGRADIRIRGNADRTLTVYWQVPNLSGDPQNDAWNLYRGSGTLPGPAPAYPNNVYIGLITYAAGSTGVPFVGTADSIEGYSTS
jgi:hypothetical protein